MSSRSSPQIFLSDSSAEAGRLLTALQAKGYTVVDVPLGMLVNRCRYELPQLVICDAHAHEAEARLAELREEAPKHIPVFLIAGAEGREGIAPGFESSATEILRRPIDLDQAVARVRAVCGDAAGTSSHSRRVRSSRAPRLVTAARKPYRSDGLADSGSSSHPPSGEPSDPHWPIDSPPGLGPLATDLIQHGPDSSPVSSRPPRPNSSSGQLSPETLAILDAGRRRVDALPRRSPAPGRPALEGSEAIELRSEILEALNEPLDESDVGLSQTPEPHARTGVGTTAGTRSGVTSPGRATPPSTERPEPTRWGTQSGTGAGTGAGVPGSTPPPHSTPEPTQKSESPKSHEAVPASVSLDDDEKTNPGGKPPTHPPSLGWPSGDAVESGRELPPLDDLSDLLATTPWDAGSRQVSQDMVITTPPPPRSSPREVPPIDQMSLPPLESLRPHALASERSVLPPSFAIGASSGDEGPHSGQRPLLLALAGAIRDRRSGAVAAQDRGGVRRAVMTDGDISTVISSIPDESLAHFLHDRGDLSQELLSSLSAIPQFGRHAGAALIARGLLGQEDLWPVLRAHSEWILCRALENGGEAVFEAQIPPRIAEEPAVFGGAAGAEIFLEAMRRTCSPDAALARLGGPDNFLSWGSHNGLLGESALSSEEQTRVGEAMGKRAGEIYDTEPELLPILVALSVLGAVTPGGSGTLQTEPPSVRAQSHRLDGEAFLRKLRARRALVDCGDYFAILGVARSASTYEVSRARDDLLQELTEVHLGAEHQELKPDLDLVRATIDEAHLVLSDEVRRMRYRRALEAIPKTS